MAELYRVTGPAKASVTKVELEARPNMSKEFFIGVGNGKPADSVTIVLTEEEAKIVIVQLMEKLKAR